MVFGFFATLLLTGTPVVFRYLGFGGIVGYWAVGLLLCLLRERAFAVFLRLDKRGAWVVGVGTVAILALASFVIYPIANSGVVGGGSDSDDALNIAVRALLNHQNPYGLRTYLGAPVTYLPGAFLLAAPFVIISSAAYQNVFWSAVFFAAVYGYLKDIHRAVMLLWILLGCLQVWQSLVTGGELLASGLYVPLAILLMTRSLIDPGLSRFRWAAAILLGIAFCSRANYLLLVPIVGSGMVQLVGWRRGLAYGFATLVTIAVLVLPFALDAPEQFWVGSVKEQNYAAISLGLRNWHVDVLLPVASALFALVLSCRRLQTESAVLATCAVAQALPVIAITLLTLTQLWGRRNVWLAFEYACYGLHVIFFWALASHRRLLHVRPAFTAGTLVR